MVKPWWTFAAGVGIVKRIDGLGSGLDNGSRRVDGRVIGLCILLQDCGGTKDDSEAGAQHVLVCQSICQADARREQIVVRIQVGPA